MLEKPGNDETWKTLATSLERVAEVLERLERPIETIVDSLAKSSEERIRERSIETERNRKKW
jgi:hypothetical protein